MEFVFFASVSDYTVLQESLGGGQEMKRSFLKMSFPVRMSKGSHAK